MRLPSLETSYTARPPVEWGVRNAGQRRTATSWPPPDAVKRTLFLAAGPTGSVTSLNDGALAEAPAAGDSASTAYTYPDPDWAIGIATAGPGAPDPVRRVLTFTSAPLAEDLELAGTAKLELYLASTCKDTDVIVRLSEQLPQSEAERAAGVQPAATIVTKGWHRASHQGKDPLHSTDDWPLYTHTERTFLTPGEITRIEVALMPMGYLFKKGSRIRLELANHDSLVTDKHFHHYYAPSKIGTDTIHHDQVYPSSLTLPVLAGG